MVRTVAFILALGVPALTVWASREMRAPVANPGAPLVAVDLSPQSEPIEQSAIVHEPAREAAAVESLPLGRAAVRESANEADVGGGEDVGFLQSPAVRTIGALTLVLSLIFGLRSLIQTASRRGNGLGMALGAGGRAPSGVLSVLGRYPVGKGATLVLLQLDRRVLLLSQTGAGFSTLCELTDPADVASVVAKTADDEGASLSRRFSSMLKRFESDPSVVGDSDARLVSPRRAMALRDYEAALAPEERAIASAPGNADSFTSLQDRLARLRGGEA